MNIIVYTDGSCANNTTKTGTYGFIVYEEKNNEPSESLFANVGCAYNTTNQRMEMTAILKACEYINNLGDTEKVTVFSDSAYCINCYNQRWYAGWKNNGWLNSKKQSVANRDLWELLIPYFENNNFSFQKVKGHSTNPYNNEVDRMIVEYRNSIADIQPDSTKRVFIINGKMGAGKDTFVEIVKKLYPNTHNFSSVDVVKAAYKLLGWNGEKTEADRNNLSMLKDLSTRMFDGPVKYLKKQIEESTGIIFCHVREPEEIKRLKSELNAKAIYINRDIDNLASNHADLEVDSDMSIYDYNIPNHGTLEELEHQAKAWLQEIDEY